MCQFLPSFYGPHDSCIIWMDEIDVAYLGDICPPGRGGGGLWSKYISQYARSRKGVANSSPVHLGRHSGAKRLKYAFDANNSDDPILPVIWAGGLKD